MNSRWITLLFTVTVIGPAAGAPARAAESICGFNHFGLTYEEWATSGSARFWEAPLADYNTLTELERVAGVDFMPDERTDLGLPASIWLIGGVENAYADRSAEGPDERSVRILLDDAWLLAMEKATSNPWLRKAVLAHELGHLVHGDVWGHGASTRWHQEYQADVFAGYAMCKLGAPEASVRELYFRISSESGSEDANRHPSRAYRLRAISEGYAQARNE